MLAFLWARGGGTLVEMSGPGKVRYETRNYLVPSHLGALGILPLGEVTLSHHGATIMNLTIKNQFRTEEDSLGDVQVPANHLWGAQTQRSHVNFPIGVERFRWGRPVIRALGILKKSAALANGELGQLPKGKVDLIVRAAQEVIDGPWDDEFLWSSFRPVPARRPT